MTHTFSFVRLESCDHCIQIKYCNNTLSCPKTSGMMDKLPPTLTYSTTADLLQPAALIRFSLLLLYSYSSYYIHFFFFGEFSFKTRFPLMMDEAV